MSRKRTYEEVRTKIEGNGYRLLDNDYKDGKTTLHIECKKCKNQRWALFEAILPRCKKCLKNERFEKRKEEFKGFVNKNNMILLSEYKGRDL